jgi:hypothetical protein
MPARASYELKIEGILKGSTHERDAEIQRFRNLMTRPTVATGELDSTEAWPNGFWLRGYDLCRWVADGYDYGDRNDQNNRLTLLSFYAEVTLFASGAIYDDNVQMPLLRDVAWFYKFKHQAWYNVARVGLEARLAEYNSSVKKELLIENLRFREWKWYCGDGGP